MKLDKLNLKYLQDKIDNNNYRYVVKKACEYSMTRSLISSKYSAQFYLTCIRQYYQNKYNKRGIDNYEAPLNPLKCRYVSPNEINNFTHRPYPYVSNKQKDIGRVKRGDWDKIGSPSAIPGYKKEYHYLKKMYGFKDFESSMFYKSLENHFQRDTPWKDTDFIQYVLEKINEEIYLWHFCETEEEVKKRCRRLDYIYKKIKNGGYIPQQKLNPKKDPARNYVEEICVDISRSGEWLFVDGRHRLAIAKILDINMIPVAVLYRHEQWMEERDASYMVDRKQHPDFIEFIEY